MSGILASAILWVAFVLLSIAALVIGLDRVHDITGPQRAKIPAALAFIVGIIIASRTR